MVESAALFGGLVALFIVILLIIGWSKIRSGNGDFHPRTLFRIYGHTISLLGLFLFLIGAVHLLTALFGAISLDFVFPHGSTSSSPILGALINSSQPSQQDLEKAQTITGIVYFIFGAAFWASHRYLMMRIEPEDEFLNSTLGALYNGFEMLVLGIVSVGSVVAFFVDLFYDIFFNGSQHAASNPPGTELAWMIVFVIAACVILRRYAYLLKLLPAAPPVSEASMENIPDPQPRPRPTRRRNDE